MKTVLSVLVVMSLLPSVVAARQWTSRSGGFSVEAELLDVKDGNAVLQKQDGSQLTVPLTKLSLGDVRYIEGVLKGAEAAITGGGDGVMTEKPPLPPATQPTKEIPLKPEDLTKLRYGWKKGQTYLYRVKISAERGDYTADFAGEITYTPNEIRSDGIELAVTGSLTRSDKTDPDAQIIIIDSPSPRFMGHPHLSYRTITPKAKNASLTVDVHGRVLQSEGNSQLPYLLGEQGALMIEPFSATNESTWAVTSDMGITVVTIYYPYYRYGAAKMHEGLAATEKTSYTMEGVNAKLITIAKHYELTTAEVVAGKPRVEARGDGKFTFDTELGVPSNLDFNMRITARERNKSEEIPVKLSYRLVDEVERAKIAKAAADAKREKERPLDAKDVENAIADLTSGDAARISRAAKLCAEKAPPQENSKATQALESAMLTGKDVLVRTDAAKALKNWSNAQSVPALLSALNDNWPPIRVAAIETLTKYKPPTAIAPIAGQLADLQTRSAASAFLKAMGPAAEDAVLLQLGSSDTWTRAAACEILAAIGTKQSIPALQKAGKDKEWMVNKPADKALTAVKLREQAIAKPE